MKRIYIVYLLVALFVFNNVFGQTLENTWEMAGSFRSVVVDSNFTYLGGGIGYYGPATGSGVVVTADNTMPVSGFPVVEGKIIVCAPDGQGGWYIGGTFSKVGRTKRLNLAHILADGTVDNWSPDPNKEVDALAVDDSSVYIAGYFTSVGEAGLKYLARIDRRTGKPDMAWDPAPDENVFAIALTSKYVYVGGRFTRMGSAGRKFVARLFKKTGNPDDSWILYPDAVVHTIALQGDAVYLGGNFTSFWGMGPAYYAAKFDTTGKYYSPFWYPNPDSYVKKIVPAGDKVYLVGDFYHVGRVHDSVVPRNYVACVYNEKGKPNLLWDPSPDSYVNDLHVGNNGIYLAGDFKTLNGNHRLFIARVNKSSGDIDNRWLPNCTSPAYCLGFSGNRIFVGGTFSSLGGVDCHNLIRLRNSDYSIDTGWMPNVNGGITGMVLDKGNLYISGNFSRIGDVQARYLAKIDTATGEADSTWTPPIVGPVSSMAATDSALFIGGNFVKDYYSHPYLARILKTGKPAKVSWWKYPAGDLLGSLSKVAVHGNYYYAAGRIYNEDRTYVENFLTRMSPVSGKEDTHWNPSPDGLVWDMVFQGNNLIVSGVFDYIGGHAHKGLAKLNLVTGSAVSPWQPDIEGGTPETLAVNRKYVYVGGSFTSVGGLPLKYVARIDYCSGNPDATWHPDLRSTLAWDADVESLFLSENHLFVSGGFNHVGEKLQSGFCVFREPEPVWEGEGKRVIALGKGSFSYHSIAICSDHKAYAWGKNGAGQLGNGTLKNSQVPVVVDTTGVLAGKKIVEVSMSLGRSMALSSDGKVFMWGDNEEGQLGNNSTTGSPVPVAVDTTGVLAGKKIVHIAAGGNFSMALDSEGKVYTWGYAIGLGNGTPLTHRKTVPVAVDTTGVLKGKQMVAIAAENQTGLALGSDGLVYTWGQNDHGQLGNASSDDNSIHPVLTDTSGVLKGKNIVAIAAGIDHALALAADGTLYAWGQNDHGQLGNHSNTDSNVPVAVDMTGALAGKKGVAIAAGGSYSLALATDGRIYAWGENNIGQLGTGTAEVNTPTAVNFSGVLSNKHIIDMAAGVSHSLVLSCRGKIYAWGGNSYGELGNPSAGEWSDSPVEVQWTPATAVNSLAGAENALHLLQNYPNPFREETTIRFTLPEEQGAEEVTLKVYDLTGRELATLVQGKKQPGSYAIPFRAAGLTPGIYFYKLRVGNRMLARKMVIEQ